MEDKQIYIEKKSFDLKKIWGMIANSIPKSSKKPKLQKPPPPLPKEDVNTQKAVRQEKPTSNASGFTKTHRENSEKIYLLSVYLLFFAILIIIGLAIVFANK